jgi:hypothetical protein
MFSRVDCLLCPDSQPPCTEQEQGTPRFLSPACASRSELYPQVFNSSMISKNFHVPDLLFSTSGAPVGRPRQHQTTSTSFATSTYSRHTRSWGGCVLQTTHRAYPKAKILPKRPIQPSRPLTPLPNDRHRGFASSLCDPSTRRISPLV